MKEITITVNKANVYDEVAKTTAYIGAKSVDDVSAYERVFTTDADREMLERFWAEACNMATTQLKRFVVQVSDNPQRHGVDLAANYEVILKLSELFDDTALADSISSSMFNFFVASIVGKWCALAAKAEAESYALEAAGLMKEVIQKAYHRSRPTRE